MPVPDPSRPLERRFVLLRLDGVLHTSDLPVQAFARHLCDALPAPRRRPLIAGMRGFLEGRTELIEAGIDLSAAEDGYQAVEILARAAGAADADIAAANRASRIDLATSAWTVDPADGLDALRTAAAGRAGVAVLLEPDDPAAAAVVREIGGQLDTGPLDVIEGPMAAGMRCLLRQQAGPADSRSVLVVGACWTGDVADAGRAGCATALIDRFGAGAGAPTWRVPNLSGLIAPVTGWLRADPTGRLI